MVLKYVFYYVHIKMVIKKIHNKITSGYYFQEITTKNILDVRYQ